MKRSGTVVESCKRESKIWPDLLIENQRFYNDFNRKHKSTINVGLFTNEHLKDPKGLVQFSKDSLRDAKSLVAQMLADVKHGEEGRLTYIRKLDQLSDILCRVIDVAEFIRNAHPQQAWVEAAQKTHEILFEYMNQLNTNVDLYTNLVMVLNDEAIGAQLTDEEINVGEYLKQDFEKSGIHMDEKSRRNFVELTQEISVIGANYSNGLHNLESMWCDVDRGDFENISDANLKKEILSFQSRSPTFERGRTNVVSIPLMEHIPYYVLTNCSSEAIRRKVWIAYHNASKHQIGLLNGFIRYRAVLARMLGYESYAHHQLEYKMAKNPENVKAFLNKVQATLLDSKENRLMDEIRSLYAYKPNADMTLSDDEIIHEVKPWDRDYLLNKLQTDPRNSAVDSNEIKEYLSIGTVMSGLNQLFESIYQIQLIPEAVGKGETWEKGQVRKIRVFDTQNQITLGYLYIDFWSPKVFPSHFTIVCSRQLNTDIGIESKDEVKNQVHLDDSETYQLPVVSLVFNFHKSTSIFPFATGPSLLNLEQVETIFHEMGHAMHSMIGRTKLQNLSGTRAATDFVELPSVLMESFAKDPRVICKIAKHYKTGEPLDQEMFEKHQKQKVILYDSEIFMQSKMALLDQVLHNADTVALMVDNFDTFDTTPIYHKLESDLGIFADKWSTWHGKFLHLFSYGAVYYSYLLDRAIADKVYKELFYSDPWSLKAGNKYKESILKWGGTRDPWLCLADALDNERLKAGDFKAMEIIAADFK
ncbi:zincin [Yamadazyma tenuis ATCC 10573]|uniref:Mitochondrial intermediate peptidase n=1 Tax=Candida tenuis (strain ATCC 10573 / BCRC 21748 / CBS 615 / JCM 9827 / NBRC 10315 / NRRL Y-1498 / VKM Y-70) TaxID=590646 RepID=G3AXF0_CANTC|nr:zincin [Yamadazyma tenuis ATCC 10573]EGV66360.1 zincin [Yamadazyma tenuis ATCC 10573]